jgi:hypothetical protein
MGQKGTSTGYDTDQGKGSKEIKRITVQIGGSWD